MKLKDIVSLILIIVVAIFWQYVKFTNQNEIDVVNRHNIRARKRGLEASLTEDEWLMILIHFGWKCAYCLEAPYEHLDHYKPICLGGGTTANNCLPSCKKCNLKKSGKDPYEAIRIGESFKNAKDKLDQLA